MVVTTSIRRLIDNLQHEMHIGGPTFNRTYWPYVVTISYDQYYNAERWCYEHFKSRNWRDQGMRHFAFKRKEDYEWFVLRWS